MNAEAARDWRVRWRLFFSEMIGTGLLVFGGVSIVIFMFGSGTPMVGLLPNEVFRTTVTAFLWGCVGTTITLSRIGRESGAHINPAVTLGFWLMKKIDARVAVGYMIAQLLGGCLGALPLLAWGAMGRSVTFGATLPGSGYSTGIVVLGEAVTTFALVSTICVFLGFRHLRSYTPFVIPFLYAVMVPLEAPISGTSTNPARTLGPAVISGRWDGFWIYWVGPLCGMLAAILICSSFAKSQ